MLRRTQITRQLEDRKCLTSPHEARHSDVKEEWARGVPDRAGVGLGAYWLPGGMLVTEAVGRTGCPWLVAGVLSTPWLCPGVTPGVIQEKPKHSACHFAVWNSSRPPAHGV